MTENHSNLSARIGQRIRAERERRRLSLSQLSEKTDHALSKSRISNYELGVRRLGLEEAQALAAAFEDVSSEYLLCLNDNPLTNQERELLEYFRRADDEGRTAILAVARSEAKDTEH
jgi:transcriptional regulator with XRE-family HTH domain